MGQVTRRFKAIWVVFAVCVLVMTPKLGHAGDCPYHGWKDDGCAGPIGTFFVARYFRAASFEDFAAQSGQHWAGGPHPWDWNSPGVDFGIGPGPRTRLADPATARLPSGCHYKPTGSLTHGAVVSCGRGAVNPKIDGLDFSLHDCTVFQADADVIGLITLSNSKFKNGRNCSIKFGYLIKIISGNAGLLLANDLIDEDYPNYSTPLVATVVINTATSPLTVKRTAILNASQRPISGTTAGPIDIENSVFVGFTLASTANGGQHGEIFELGAPAYDAIYPSVVYRNNVVVIPAVTAGTVTAPFYPNGLNGKRHVISRFIVDHNVVVTNFAGGPAAKTAMRIDGVVEGNRLTVQPGYAGGISVGSMILGLPRHGLATIIRQLDADHYLLSGTPPTGSFSGGNTLRVTTSVALAEMSYAKEYKYVAITNNFVDAIGALSCIQNLGSSIDELTISGNRSLTTLGPITGVGYRQSGASCPPLF